MKICSRLKAFCRNFPENDKFAIWTPFWGS